MLNKAELTKLKSEVKVMIFFRTCSKRLRLCCVIFKWQYHHLKVQVQIKVQTLPGQQSSGSSLSVHYSCVDSNQGLYEENVSKKQNILKCDKEIFTVVSIGCQMKRPYCLKVCESNILSS